MSGDKRRGQPDRKVMAAQRAVEETMGLDFVQVYGKEFLRTLEKQGYKVINHENLITAVEYAIQAAIPDTHRLSVESEHGVAVLNRLHACGYSVVPKKRTDAEADQ